LPVMVIIAGSADGDTTS